jgi:outer membrane protein OmpA-like peptidoglycan-associated protein
MDGDSVCLIKDDTIGNNMGADCIHEASLRVRDKTFRPFLFSVRRSFMHSSRFRSGLIAFVAASMLVCLYSPQVAAQSDLPRQAIAITYPLDETVTVKFRGTTRLPRLKGEAKVKRAGRRGTRVELDVENLPRATELGGAYTTYVLWAISPEGRLDNLGEIKRSGSFIVDSKLDVTTPLQTFALLLTAEPHFLVRTPSRMVVLENLPPIGQASASIATMSVNYLGNTSDYFKEGRVPEVADAEYLKTPVSLLGARQAVNLARYAGAEREASDEFQQAAAQLEEAENAWRLKQSEAEIDAGARRATSLAVKAEEAAESRKGARVRREDIARRDAAVRTAEESAATASKQIEDMRVALQKEQRARELAERDAANAQEQLRDARTELARLRDEVQTIRAQSEDARLQLARIEGEKKAELARTAVIEETARQKETEAMLKRSLAKFGTVRQTNRGLIVVLPETIWSNARGSDMSPKAAASIDPLAALLATTSDYQITIESHTDGRGDQDVLQQMTQERARALAERLISGGVDNSRIQANGMGATQPVASNGTASGRSKNRRTEVILSLSNGRSTTAAN